MSVSDLNIALFIYCFLFNIYNFHLWNFAIKNLNKAWQVDYYKSFSANWQRRMT